MIAFTLLTVNTDDRPLMMRVHKQGDETAEGIVMTPLATDLLFDDTSFTVVLGDGRRLKIPIRCFPRLAAATREQRDAFRISATGAGLHWDALDEDISVAGLLRGQMDETVR